MAISDSGSSDPGARGNTGPPLEKPPELLALTEPCAELFTHLQKWFAVPQAVEFDLSAIDRASAIRSMSEPAMVAAFAMRKLQAIHLLAHPGVPTKPDVVLTLIDAVLRALVEAPAKHLDHRIANTNWDREWAVLDAGMHLASPSADGLARFLENVRHLANAHAAMVDYLEQDPTLI